MRLSKLFIGAAHIFGIVEVDVNNPPCTLGLMSDGLEDASNTITLIQLFREAFGLYSELCVDVFLLIGNSLMKLLGLSLESLELADVVLQRVSSRFGGVLFYVAV